MFRLQSVDEHGNITGEVDPLGIPILPPASIVPEGSTLHKIYELNRRDMGEISVINHHVVKTLPDRRMFLIGFMDESYTAEPHDIFIANFGCGLLVAELEQIIRENPTTNPRICPYYAYLAVTEIVDEEPNGTSPG